MISASQVRASWEENKNRAIFTLPDYYFNAFGPTEDAENLIDRYIVFRSGAGYVDVVIGVPCLSDHSDAWNFDTARMVGRMYERAEYSCSVYPTAECFGDKRFILLTIRWDY